MRLGRVIIVFAMQAAITLAASAPATVSQADASAKEWESLVWSQVIAGTKNDYFFESIAKPEPRIGHQVAAFPTNEILGADVAYADVYAFGGFGKELENSLWRYKGGIWNSSLGSLLDDYGVCDTENIGTECSSWSRVGSSVELRTCEGGTCRSMLFPESEYYASDPGLLKRMYHSMSLMFKDEADGASAGGSGKLLVYGGDNGVNRLGDVWTWSPGSSAVFLSIERIDVSVTFACDNYVRIYDSSSAPEKLLFDSCRHMPAGASISQALQNAGLPCARAIIAASIRVEYRSLDRCPSFAGFELSAFPAPSINAACSMVTPEAADGFAATPVERSEHAAVVSYTSSTSTVVKTASSTSTSAKVAAAAGAIETARLDLENIDFPANITESASGFIVERSTNLPPEIQTMTCRSDDSLPSRCFQLFFMGYNTSFIRSQAKEAEIRSALLEIPVINDVRVVINGSNPRLEDLGGGCFLPQFSGQDTSLQCGTEPPRTSTGFGNYPFEACVIDPQTGVADSFFNGIKITFTDVVSCTRDRQCDLELLGFKFVDFQGDFCNTSVSEDMLQGFKGSHTVVETFKGVNPYNLIVYNNHTRGIMAFEEASASYTIAQPAVYSRTDVDAKSQVNVTIIVDTEAAETWSIQSVLNTTTSRGSTEGYIRLVVFGGWDGTTVPDDGVWVYDLKRQLDESGRPPGSNFDEASHPDFPALTPISVWERIATTGTQPGARYAHAAVAHGFKGGSGADRYSMVIFGGRNSQGHLADAWELTLAATEKAYHEHVVAVTLSCASTTSSMQYEIRFNGSSFVWNITSTAQEVADGVLSLPSVRPPASDSELTSWLSTYGDQPFCQSDTEMTLLLTPNITWPTAISAYSEEAARAYVQDVIAPEWTVVATNLTADPSGGSTSVNDTSASWIRVGSRVAWQPETTYTWRALASASSSQPSARAYHSLTYFRESDASSGALYVYGGWNMQAVKSDLWRGFLRACRARLASLPPSSSTLARTVTEKGKIWWELVSDGGDIGIWMSCRPRFYPISWYGLSCNTNRDGELPARYMHQATVVTSEAGKRAMFVYGGAGTYQMARGDNSKRGGLWSGGEDADMMRLCPAAEPGCAQVVFLSAATRVAELVSLLGVVAVVAVAAAVPKAAA